MRIKICIIAYYVIQFLYIILKGSLMFFYTQLLFSKSSL